MPTLTTAQAIEKLAQAVEHLAQAHTEGCSQIAYQLRKLGLADAATPMGAIEALSKSLEEGLGSVAASVSELATATSQSD